MKFTTFGPGEQWDSAWTDPAPAMLGGKGAGLVWMVQQGVSVPPGFILPVSVWEQYDKKPKTTMKAIAKELPVYLKMLDKHFGYRPLVSVRSGARTSMPGMMDTILNVGIDAKSEEFWLKKLGSATYDDTLHRLVAVA